MSNPNKSEWFLRQSKWLKSWRIRYVVLEGHHLHCSKEDDVAAHDAIDLARCSRILLVRGLYKQQSGIKISTIDKKKWLLCIDDMAVLHDWIETLVVKAVAMYVETRQNDIIVAQMLAEGKKPPEDAYEAAIASALDKDKEAHLNGLVQSTVYVSTLRKLEGRASTQLDSFAQDEEALARLILAETVMRAHKNKEK